MLASDWNLFNFLSCVKEMQFNSIILQILLAAGLTIIVNAALNGGEWKEFYQYFRESKFVSVFCV